MTHIGLNAHLLSAQAGYRAAGIHNVIHRLLTHLPDVMPQDWQFTAMVGSRITTAYPGIAMQRSALNTESPLPRIVWEQVVQPLHTPHFDLLHALAFVSPLVSFAPRSVVTVYDLTFLRYPERLSASRRLYLRWLTALSCQRADRITVISHSTGDDVVNLLGIPRDKIDVTPLGYERATMYPRPAAEVAAFRQAKGLPERFWLFIGTIEPRKNLPQLLQAYARLPHDERLPLILGGGGGWGLAPVQDTIARRGLSQSVHLAGFIPSEELPLWYNAADVFLYPSVFEGFGLPVLEAMACGTPVITSNVSSLPEVAEGAGLCLPPDDIDAWTDALHTLARDDQWRSTARIAGIRKASQFDWQHTARLTIESYRKALARA